MTAPDVWLTTNEAAERAKCCAATVLRSARAGELRGTRRGGSGHWRFRERDVDAWLSGGSVVVLDDRRRA